MDPLQGFALPALPSEKKYLIDLPGLQIEYPDLNVGTPPVLDTLREPYKYELANQAALSIKRQSTSADVIPSIQMGFTPQEIAQQQQQAAFDAKRQAWAMDATQKITSALDSASTNPEYATALESGLASPQQQTQDTAKRLQDLLNAPSPKPPVFKVPKFRMPGLAEILTSVVGAAFSGRHGAEVLAAPFEAAIGGYKMAQERAQQQYAIDKDRYEMEQNQRQNELNLGLRMLDIDRQMLHDQAVQGNTKAAQIEAAVGRVNAANYPGEATIALDDLRQLDPARAQRYGPLVAEIEADRKAAYNRSAQAANDIALLRGQRLAREQQLVEFHKVYDPLVLAGKKTTNARLDVRLLLDKAAEANIPVNRQLLEQRLANARLYPIELYNRVQTSEFQMGMAIAQFGLATDRYNQDASEFNANQLRYANEAARSAISRDKQYAVEEWRRLSKEISDAKGDPNVGILASDADDVQRLKGLLKLTADKIASANRMLGENPPPAGQVTPTAPPSAPNVPNLKTPPGYAPVNPPFGGAIAPPSGNVNQTLGRNTKTYRYSYGGWTGTESDWRARYKQRKQGALPVEIDDAWKAFLAAKPKIIK